MSGSPRHFIDTLWPSFTGHVGYALLNNRTYLSRPLLTTPEQHIIMAEPPSYEESTSGVSTSADRKSDRKTTLPWSIREQVGLSRSQHVASIVSQIVEHIKERALRGLSKTTLVLIPSDQGTLRSVKSSAAKTNSRKLLVEKASPSASQTAKHRL